MEKDQKLIYDRACERVSRTFTTTYSTSFSLAINCLDKDLHRPIHSIYGFVRLADEIVDSFHNYRKAELLAQLRADTVRAMADGISLNPILNSFQWVVNTYAIEWELIDQFLCSMEMDLEKSTYDREKYNAYILGSAEVVGLMCLRVFCKGNQGDYDQLKAPAMRLGAAFQKVNFLRDMRADHFELGRTYFPDVDVNNFNEEKKGELEAELRADFEAGYQGILGLPKQARFGVYMAYVYYWALFAKIEKTPSTQLLSSRLRISNGRKMGLLARSLVLHKLNLL